MADDRIDGGKARYERSCVQPENPFIHLISDQEIAIIPTFTLESGVVLYNVPLAYKTYGKLAPAADNAMVICHAVTGSADVGDWWGPLLGGPGKAFDISRFFVVCMNSLGSPYGTASPVTAKNGDPAQGQYGPEFPLTTIRDDVNIFRLLLDDLGVKQIATVIGGSMGGMLVLEFSYFGKDYVRSVVAMATSPRFSAWGISWGEAQRQSIYSDPKYDDGYYPFDDPPSTGLGAARMSALLTYRSRDSFETRFGRKTPDTSRKQSINGTATSTPTHEHFAIHNEGHRLVGGVRTPRSNSVSSLASLTVASSNPSEHAVTDPQFSGTTPLPLPTPSSAAAAAAKRMPTYYSAQSYLRYQGQKFINRFDANCYIAMSRKLDTHDLSRGRFPISKTSSTSHLTANGPEQEAEGEDEEEDPILPAMRSITQPTLILGIKSDGLFTFAEQTLLAATIPNASLEVIDSPEGHDAFLLEFEQVNGHVLRFLEAKLPDIMKREPDLGIFQTSGDTSGSAEFGEGAGFQVAKSSTFGEAEVDDITAW